jgi:hypothetical protein
MRLTHVIYAVCEKNITQTLLCLKGVKYAKKQIDYITLTTKQLNVKQSKNKYFASSFCYVKYKDWFQELTTDRDENIFLYRLFSNHLDCLNFCNETTEIKFVILI